MKVHIPDIHVGDREQPMKVLKKWQKEFFVRGRYVYLNKDKEIAQFHEFLKSGLAIVCLEEGEGKLFQCSKDQILDANMPKVTAIQITKKENS